MYYELYVPFPPTVNSYYQKSRAGGRFISKKGQKFRADVATAIHEQLPSIYIDDRMLVEVVLFPPDARVRDVDNYNKALLDAISLAGLWEDDNLIDQLFNYRGQKIKGGMCLVRVTDAGPVIPPGGSPPMD